ncbi:hypothetical protein ACFXO9_26645 [Nocardia tengchongensis]|uniref:hypothetical protein n=1 Tax=Nocardia tengchongensis TaxID=2055889 RepID=UPI0036BE63F8
MVVEPSISCPRCGMRSYAPGDIDHKYCGNCHAFHDGCGRTRLLVHDGSVAACEAVVRLSASQLKSDIFAAQGISPMPYERCGGGVVIVSGGPSDATTFVGLVARITGRDAALIAYGVVRSGRLHIFPSIKVDPTR